MGRIFGILLFVLALWFGAQMLTGDRPAQDDSASSVPTTQRVRDSVLQAQEEGMERRRKLLPE